MLVSDPAQLEKMAACSDKEAMYARLWMQKGSRSSPETVARDFAFSADRPSAHLLVPCRDLSEPWYNPSHQ